MAVKPPLVPHYYTDGSIRYVLSLPDVYEGEQSTIASALGITRPENFEPDDDDVGLSVSEGLRTGKLIRLRLSYRDVINGRNVTKSTKIICPTNKVDTGASHLCNEY